MSAKSETLLRIASKFTKELDEETKDKIAWYLLGKEEERAKWEKKFKELQTA